MSLELQTYSLDEPFDLAMSYTPWGLLIEEYTGEIGACYISRGRQGKPIVTVVTGRILDYDEPLVNLWIHNTKAQPGHRLTILTATRNAVRSLVRPETPYPSSLEQGAVTVGTTAVALPSHPVPLGLEVVVLADVTNSAPVYIGPQGVTVSTGIRVDPGGITTMRVADSSAIYAISPAANQRIIYSIGLTSQITQATLNPTQVVEGVLDVGTSPTQFPDQPIPPGVTAVIRGDEGNTKPIYIGGSSVTVGTGHYLNAFDSINLAVDNLNKIFAVAAITGQKARYIVEAY